MAIPAMRIWCLLALLVTTVLLVTGGVGVLASPTSAAEPPEAPQAEFTGAVGYGIAVAMSTDGSTAVVGQLGYSQSGAPPPGVAHVFTFDGSGWTQQAELTASDPSYDTLFGNAVAVSADGNTVIVGDPGECGYGLENCEHGAAYVFVRDGSTWTQQAELHGGPGFGGAVALSGDGNTALVGAGLSGYYGFFYAPGGNAPPTLFSRSGTTWTQRQRSAAANASGPFDNFGHSVALSADGHTALIGDPTQNEEAGAAYVFTGSGSTWTQQAELTGSDEMQGWNFGASVALSADGQAAIVGAPAPGAGSAYVFAGSGSTWTQQSELTPDDAEVKSFDGWFGDAVALDSEGNVALVGAPWSEEDFGAVYAFGGEGSNWGQLGEFVLANATPYDYFGDAVALNGEGNVALIGRYDPGVDFFRVPAPSPRIPTGTKPPGTTIEQRTDIDIVPFRRCHDRRRQRPGRGCGGGEQQDRCRHSCRTRVRARPAQACRAQERAHHLPRSAPSRRRLLLRRDRAEALQGLHAGLAAALRHVKRHAAHGLRLPTVERRGGARADAR